MQTGSLLFLGYTTHISKISGGKIKMISFPGQALDMLLLKLKGQHIKELMERVWYLSVGQLP